MTDIYKEITDSIIAQLEQGCAPWVKPWNGSTAHGLPTNLQTGNAYRGINTLALWASGARQGFSSDLWGTYKQIQALGGQVRRGEKGTRIIKFGQYERENADGDTVSGAYIKAYAVFNSQQCDGLNLESFAAPELPEAARDLAAEAFISATGASISCVHGRGAFYQPATDKITLPLFSDFPQPADYYCTALHELGHWTGHKSRLDREMRDTFGSPNYAKEELVAELTAAFLCAQLHLDGQLQHASYIASWLRVLKDDSRAIFRAASAASKAADFLTAFSNSERAAAA